MPVPSSIADLSTSAGSNSPAGTEAPSTLDNYQRAHASFIAQLRAVIGGATDANIPSVAVTKDSSTGAANLPSGTTAQRPASPVTKQIRYNTDLVQYEAYQTSAWASLYTSASTRMAYGVAPSAWAAGYSTLDLGTFGISSNQSGVLTFLGNNIYFDGTNYKHKIDGVGHVISLGALGIPLVFSAAAAGTAGNNASLVTMFAIDANGRVAVSSPTGALGYGNGAGGAVTQITNKSTGVTLDRPCGQITMSGASLAASTAVSFTLTNSLITATDNIDANIQSGAATGGSYNLTVDAVAAGSCRVSLRNMTAGALAEALVLNISVKKSVNA